MTFAQMIEGLQILAKYEDRGLETSLNGADHDVIWACTAQIAKDDPGFDTRISPEDARRLDELGWFISSEYAEAWTHYC